LIVDLSSPEGSSVNEGIDTELAILSYASIDHLAALVAMEGKGSLLVKAIIKEAYRMIPIHPEPTFAGRGVGGNSLDRQDSAIWPKIRLKDLLGSGRCCTSKGKSYKRPPLPR